MKIKVAIVDDHALIREGLKKLLELEDAFEITLLARDGCEAIDLIKVSRPDVVLLDINMPNMNGIECLKRIKSMFPDIKVIMLTIHDEAKYVIESINIGADGYILKDVEVPSIIKAIHMVVKGEVYIHPSLSGILVREYKHKSKMKDEVNKSTLTKREFEVIKLIADGYNNKDIALNLYISEKTVKNHVSNIFKKIKVVDRTQAALYAIKHNITNN